MAKQIWLECTAEKGMFDGEVSVSLNAVGGTVSLFLPESRIRRQAGQAQMQVQLLDENDHHGLVELPRVPLAGSAVVKVERRMLSPT